MSRRMITSTLILFLLSCGSVAVAQDGVPTSRLAAKYLIQDDSVRPQLEPARPDEKAEAEQQGQPEELTSSPTGWQLKSIREIKLDVRDNAERTPTDRSYELAQYGRPGDLATSEKVFAWAAPNIRYQPLYFEDVALERYGQTLPPNQQFVASNLHFWKSFLTLPRQMRFDPPKSCDYPLGFCRPGDTVPYTIQRQIFK